MKIQDLVLLGLFASFAACEKNNNNGTETVPTQIIEQLNVIFSEDNGCLLNSHKDTILYTIFSKKDFTKVDSCNEIPEIDFVKYTLIAGKIHASLSDSIFNVNLTSNSEKAIYKMEVQVDTCKECYPAVEYLYFWRLYSKLQSDYKFEFLINNI